MRTVLSAVMLCVLLVPGAAQAKRAEAAAVVPVVYKGIRYSAPNDDGRRGHVVATDAKTGKTLYDIVVFRTGIDPALEEDVQWVFIKGMKIEEGRLMVTDEKGRVYAVDLKTREVKLVPHAAG
jgi:hypothetical protein